MICMILHSARLSLEFVGGSCKTALNTRIRHGRCKSLSQGQRLEPEFAGVSTVTTVNSVVQRSWYAGHTHTGANERHLSARLGWVAQCYGGRYCKDCGDSLRNSSLTNSSLSYCGRNRCCGNPDSTRSGPQQRDQRNRRNPTSGRFARASSRSWRKDLSRWLQGHVEKNEPTRRLLGNVALAICRVAHSLHLELLLLKCVGRHWGNNTWNTSVWCCCP